MAIAAIVARHTSSSFHIDILIFSSVCYWQKFYIPGCSPHISPVSSSPIFLFDSLLPLFHVLQSFLLGALSFFPFKMALWRLVLLASFVFYWLGRTCTHILFLFSLGCGLNIIVKPTTQKERLLINKKTTQVQTLCSSG